MSGISFDVSSMVSLQLILLPAHSLTRNIGIGGAATHTHVVTDVLRSQSQPVTFPLRHPPTVEFSRAVDQKFFGSCCIPHPWESASGVLKSAGWRHGCLKSSGGASAPPDGPV